MSHAATHDTRGTGRSPVHVSLAHVLRAEWIKLRSLRSTWWLFGISVVLPIGVAVLVSALIPKVDQLSGDPAKSLLVSAATGGLTIAVLIVAALGAIAITGEYGTGMIRSTFLAVPKRLPALFAKMAVIAASAFVVSSVAIWVGALIGFLLLRARGADVVFDGSVALPLLGGGLYVALVALFAFGVGTFLRSTAGALATVFGILLVAPIIANLLARLLNVAWMRNVASVLPDSAGAQLYAYRTSSTPGLGVTDGVLTLDGWTGLAILVGWVVLVIVLGVVLVRRRDA